MGYFHQWKNKRAIKPQEATEGIQVYIVQWKEVSLNVCILTIYEIVERVGIIDILLKKD